MYRRTKIYGHYGNKIEDAQRKMGMSQAKLAKEIGVTQASVNRYETARVTPPAEVLLFYADRFDVSLDYIYGRTEKPQGKLYNYQPKLAVDSDEMRKFVEMCFDPKSPMNERLKQVLVDLLEQSKDSLDKG